MAVRGVLLQAFHWDTEGGGKHWDVLASRADEFKDNGITAIWIPPPYKGDKGMASVGYDVYDLYDLGEFQSRPDGHRETKYGSKEQLTNCVKTLQSKNLDVYVDTVLNHRMGAEGSQTVKATPYDVWNRSKTKGDLKEIRAWTVFDYPARNGKYSQYKWDWKSFDSVDFDANDPDNSGKIVYLLEGKKFDDFVSVERGGNFDHLLGADIDFQAKYVREELTRWGKWIVDKSTCGGFQGMRLDAVKHIPAWFWPDFLREVKAYAKTDGQDNFFVVGEFVKYGNLDRLRWYLDQVDHEMSLFDFPLLDKFNQYSFNGNSSDMRRIFDFTLTQAEPQSSVTFIANHDTVPGQMLQKHVNEWFKPLAYALILLRVDGYPCLFLADIDGAKFKAHGGDHEITMPSFKDAIYAMCRARRDATYGKRTDYFDHYHRIGWTFDGRTGKNGEKTHKALAVMMSGGPGGDKTMHVGSPGLSFKDVLGNTSHTVTSDDDGYALFSCKGGSVSVYLEE